MLLPKRLILDSGARVDIPLRNNLGGLYWGLISEVIPYRFLIDMISLWWANLGFTVGLGCLQMTTVGGRVAGDNPDKLQPCRAMAWVWVVLANQNGGMPSTKFRGSQVSLYTSLASNVAFPPCWRETYARECLLMEDAVRPSPRNFHALESASLRLTFHTNHGP